jgi:hypothetical protein
MMVWFLVILSIAVFFGGVAFIATGGLLVSWHHLLFLRTLRKLQRGEHTYVIELSESERVGWIPKYNRDVQYSISRRVIDDKTLEPRVSVLEKGAPNGYQRAYKQMNTYLRSEFLQRTTGTKTWEFSQ